VKLLRIGWATAVFGLPARRLRRARTARPGGPAL